MNKHEVFVRKLTKDRIDELPLSRTDRNDLKSMLRKLSKSGKHVLTVFQVRIVTDIVERLRKKRDEQVYKTKQVVYAKTKVPEEIVRRLQVLGSIPSLTNIEEISTVNTNDKQLKGLVSEGSPFLFMPQSMYAKVLCPKCMMGAMDEGETKVRCEYGPLQCVMDSYGYTKRFVTFWHCVTCNTEYRLWLSTCNVNNNTVPRELSLSDAIRKDTVDISIPIVSINVSIPTLRKRGRPKKVTV